jgi:predicted dinucleotide-utilizing enzyme
MGDVSVIGTGAMGSALVETLAGDAVAVRSSAAIDRQATGRRA